MPGTAKSSQVPMLRTNHLKAFARTLSEIGVEVDLYLNRHGLPAQLDRRDSFVPIERVWSFLDEVAREEDPLFGWRSGAQTGGNAITRQVLAILDNDPSLYQALLHFAQLVNSEATHLHVELFGRGRDVLVSVYYPGMRELPGHAVAQAYQLQVILDLIRHHLGPDWMPAEIGLECDTQAPGIESFLPGTRIHTSQDRGYIAIPRSQLYRPSKQCEPRQADASVDRIPTKFSFVESLQGVLGAYLADGYPSAQFAAGLMKTSQRTLERRLEHAGTSYREVVDRVRYDAARALLGDSDLHIRDIASSVGFTDQRNFARMFRRISGMSPREYRRASA